MFKVRSGFIRQLSAAATFLLLTQLVACGGSPPTNSELESEAFDDLREEVRESIEDSDREAAVIEVVDQLHAEFTNLRKLAEERRENIRALNSDYDATREQFVDLIKKSEAEREISHQKFQDLRGVLERSVTAEEWDSLQRTNTKAMASLAKLIAAI